LAAPKADDTVGKPAIPQANLDIIARSQARSDAIEKLYPGSMEGLDSDSVPEPEPEPEP